jgi:predicted nucleic acid-binding protein
MKKIFVDTNILIDFSKGYKTVLNTLFASSHQDQELYINPVVLAEYFSDKNFRNTKLLSEGKEFIRLFENLDITRDVGIMAGDYISKGYTLFLGDALIAATCVINNCLLCTRNRKDFAKIPHLQFYT